MPQQVAKPSISAIRDYTIVEEIGSGGMAVVYRGIQESLGRSVAIKALKTSVSADANLVARFEREALSVASFQHENLITLYDYFRERGALFMVMEFVDGIDLYDLIEICPKLPDDIVAIVALQVARALDYAHFRGIIHRDVKPANIILSKVGEVKLTDFGIARVQQSDLTETGVGLGTPGYMSPEQIVGDPMDHRTDIWSLGVVCYQMLAGKKPFIDRERRSALQQIRLDEPPPLHKVNPQCPVALERILGRCMRKAPDQRYSSAQELVIVLEHYLAQRVTANYRARILNFLREQGVISRDESNAMLHPALVGDYSLASKSPPEPFREKRTARTVLLVAVALTLGLCGGWLLNYVMAERDAQKTPQVVIVTQSDHAQGETSAASKPGRLRVLVHPWAHVEIDGKRVATTPIDETIPLQPGPHVVRFVNPYFQDQTHDVEIYAGKTRSLTAALSRPQTTSEGGSR